jgi:hypothetical protein
LVADWFFWLYYRDAWLLSGDCDHYPSPHHHPARQQVGTPMTEPTNHTVTVHTGFSHDITAPVIYVKDLGGNRALVHLESDYYIDDGRDHAA